MLKKQIKYVDYDGRERNETFYFNLNKAELTDMELTTVGGMQRLIDLIIDKQNMPEIIKTFKKIILMSYGEKSADGRRFIKSEELSTAFSQTEAFSELYMELISNGQAAADFLNAIVPPDIAARAAEAEKKQQEEEDAAKKEVELHLLDSNK